MSIGYPDGQRVQNYDGPVEWNINAANVNVAQVSPIVDVSRYACIAGNVLATLQQSLLVLRWFADPQATIQVGERIIVLSPNIGEAAQFLIPNLGPFCTLTVQAAAGGVFSVSAIAWPSNRIRPFEFQPFFPILLSVQNTSISAGGTLQVNPTDYWSGPAQLAFGASSTSYTLIVSAYNTAGGVDRLWSPPNPTTDIIQNLILPPAGILVKVVNNATSAVVFNFALTASQSGSS